MSDRASERTIRESIEMRPDFAQLTRRLRAGAVRRRIDYQKGPDRRIPINLMVTPAVLGTAQVRFLHRLTNAINGVIRRMPELFHTDPEVRAVLPFPADEEDWVRDCYRRGTRQPLVTRIDYDVHNAGPGATLGTVAFEPNGVSIGGIYYAGACPALIQEVVLDGDAHARICQIASPCAGVVRLMSRHGRATGLGARPRVGIIENRDWTDGITEMPRLAEALERAGMTALLGDPRDLKCGRGGFTLGGEPVDLLYRNMEVRDFADLVGAGHPLTALREAMRRDRVVSALAGDFDHKSLWEVLTSRRTRHVIPPVWREPFRRHVLWTRLVRETRTENPSGREVDLVPWIRRHREHLVLKPNRSCGGDRVTLGPHLDERAWDRAIDVALKDGSGWVVQSYHEATCKAFPAMRNKRVVSEKHFVCYGVISIDRDVDILGRACIRPVVNVAAGGGLMAVFRERR